MLLTENGNINSTLEVKPSMGRVARLSWAYYWRAYLITFIATTAFSIAIELPAMMLGWTFLISLAKTIAIVSGIFFSIGGSIASLKMIVGKQFKDYRLVMKDRSAQETKPKVGQLARIWWAHTWREYLVAAGVGIVAMVPVYILAGMAVPLLFGPSSIISSIMLFGLFIVMLGIGLGAYLLSSMFAFKMIIGKEINGAKLAMVQERKTPMDKLYDAMKSLNNLAKM